MKSIRETNLGHTLEITLDSNEVRVYMLYKESLQPVNNQQFNLPDMGRITYRDGSVVLHVGNYCLLRHWKMPNGEIVDRVAIPWSNLYLKK